MRYELLNPIRHLSQLQMSIQRHSVKGGLRQWIGKRYSFLRYSIPGESIFEKEWDVLVILDACRFDLMQETGSKYSYINHIGKATSKGSSTAEWMNSNFISEYSEEMENTIYVCGNPHSRNHLDEDDFSLLDEVWEYAWEDQSGTVHPRPITNRAVRAGRERNDERLIVHYMQPHVPFISNKNSPGLNRDNFGGDYWKAASDDWALLQQGERTLEEVWEDYQQNLKLVLDDLEILINNIDSDSLVISSDHGNAIGECGITGHPTNVPHPALRTVPWIELETEDSGNHSPSNYRRQEEATPKEVKQRLSSLGYV